MGANTTAETLELLKAARQTPIADEIAKGFTQSTNQQQGLTYYDLEVPAKHLVPVLTPLRNKIPRVSGKGGIQANWKAVTGINVNNLNAAISPGNRGGVIATSTAEFMAAYRGIGLEDYVQFEAGYAAEGLEDLKALAVEGLLQSLMIGEEAIILGGNTTLKLGTTPTPTVVGSSTGGALPAGAFSVVCVALGFDAYWAMGGWNNGQTGSTLNIQTAQVPALVTRVNADNSTDTYGGGSAQKSASATVTLSGATSSATATVAPVRGAVGYAWFWGAPGAELLGAVTTINSVAITGAALGSQAAISLPASDNSTNTLEFDGMLTQIANPDSKAYYKALPTGTAGQGSTLTSDGAGGIVEIDSALFAYWNLYRLSPDEIHVNAQQLLDMNKKVLAGGGAPLYRFNIDAVNPGLLNAGVVIGSYLNKITNKQIKIVIHPNMPPGTLMFWTDTLPYKLNGIQNLLQIRARQEYYQIEWPLRTRKWEYGVYADEVLQNYFPPAFGVITNIAAG